MGQTVRVQRKVTRFLIAVVVVLVTLLPGAALAPLTAASGERTLYLHYTHTGETTRITFRRNGRYDQAGLRDLNNFLRDWRRDEPTRMDPALFDLIWQVYQDVNATNPVYVVSAYRAPETNEMLRSRSNAVAKNSRHTQGKAMDFYIPGIPISKLREAAMRRQVGGVGYYPTSGSPFVHLDTGNVRAWPRMTRAQLTRLFPTGRTLHLPSDGVPISQEGRRYASNEWTKCGSVPCIGSSPNTAPTRGGSNDNSSGGSGRTLMDLFFGTNDNTAVATQVADAGPTQRRVTSVNITPPTPAARADFLAFRDPVAPPIPVVMPETIFVATRATSVALPDAAVLATTLDPIAVASIDQQARPTARVLLSRSDELSDFLTAYAPIAEPEPDAQRALQMLIERRNSADALIANNPVDSTQHLPVTPSPTLRGSIITASLSPVPDLNLDQVMGLFDATWDAVITAGIGQQALADNTEASVMPRPQIPGLAMRTIELFAPDLDHVSQAFVTPVFMSGAHFAIMFEPDEGNFSKETELGTYATRVYFSTGQSGNLMSNRFTPQTPYIMAAL